MFVPMVGLDNSFVDFQDQFNPKDKLVCSFPSNQLEQRKDLSMKVHKYLPDSLYLPFRF